MRTTFAALMVNKKSGPYRVEGGCQLESISTPNAERDSGSAIVGHVEGDVHGIARCEMVRSDLNDETHASKAMSCRGVIREHHSLCARGAPDTGNDKDGTTNKAHLVFRCCLTNRA
jgi:hypothetical protein